MKDETHPTISSLLDVLSKQLVGLTKTGMSRSEALAQNKCSGCGGDAMEFRDETSKKEFSLTAWCQVCQDNYFGSSHE